MKFWITCKTILLFSFYFWCKYNERDELKRILSEAERRKIKLKLERMDKLRSTFDQDANNNPFHESMIKIKSEWRTRARNFCWHILEKGRIENRLEKEDPIPTSEDPSLYEY
jgi:hypothetical protein